MPEVINEELRAGMAEPEKIVDGSLGVLTGIGTDGTPELLMIAPGTGLWILQEDGKHIPFTFKKATFHTLTFELKGVQYKFTASSAKLPTVNRAKYKKRAK